MIPVINKKEITKIECYMNLAAEEAKKSNCIKSKRGALIVKENEIIGKGYNKVTLEDLCNPCIREDIKDNSRVELCFAIHAEQMAILNAVNSSKPLTGSRIYHVKIKNGEIVAAGKPSCTVCSRLIYESGISEVVLLHEDGYFIYKSKEFNELSFEYFLNKA